MSEPRDQLPSRPRRLARDARRVALTALARLRFLVILGVIGLVLVKWDWLRATYEKWHRPADATVADPNSEYYCPMHLTVVRDTNKEKCPICFMPLSKRKKGEDASVALPPGVVNRVQLSPYRIVLAGVKTVAADYHPLAKELSTVGTVEFDERGLRRVAARVRGRIDRLIVNQTGQMVRAGDPLAEVYSPDLVVTVQNMLDARKGGNAELEGIARDRLRLWGIEADQLKAILDSGKPITHLTVRSPIDGHVIKKYPIEGGYVEEGNPLFDVADLKTVWVQAQVYEDDLAFLPGENHALAEGDKLPAVATTAAFPGETFPGTLSFVYPHVDPETRTLTVRFELTNPKNKLRPGITATVSLHLDPARLAGAGGAAARMKQRDGKVLAVPEAAVIDTGTQKLVYRQGLPDEFDGVLVDLGPRLTDPAGVVYYPVLAGLEPGDRVVGAGSFLVDAETRLNPAAGSIYFGGTGGGAKNAAPVRPSSPEDAEARRLAALAALTSEDRRLVEQQRVCPVRPNTALGAMGRPVKLALGGQTVFLCCSSCEEKAKSDPAATAAAALALRGGKAPVAAKGPDPNAEAEIRAELARLSAADRALAERQRFCPETGERLGAMGVPRKVTAGGQVIFTCCKGCDEEVLADPKGALKKLDALRKAEAARK
jgi:Cu(I)/Ag(I) efflux system membrane fusion protein